MGMMTEYYHYIFTTLVSMLALLFICCQNYMLCCLLHFFSQHYPLDNVCVLNCFLFLSLLRCKHLPVFACCKAKCIHLSECLIGDFLP